MRGDPAPRVISSESEKSFSFAVKKKRENSGKRETPYLLRSGITALHSGRKRQYKKMLLIHSFLFRYVSQPPLLRGTSFHRKEGEAYPHTKAFPHGKGSDARIPLPIPSFLALARNLFHLR
jgi:hypothetical protein